MYHRLRQGKNISFYNQFVHKADLILHCIILKVDRPSILSCHTSPITVSEEYGFTAPSQPSSPRRKSFNIELHADFYNILVLPDHYADAYHGKKWKVLEKGFQA